VKEAPAPPPVEREPRVRPDDRPARVGDLRSLRRWLLVAAVWATAATAIAVIALIAADNAREDNTEAGRRSARAASQIGDVQRRLNGRLAELDRRLDAVPSAEDVSDLGNRLKRVEGANGRTEDQLETLSGSIEDLEARIESLEESPADSPPAGE
jgi:small-conductance mechanosensitive channel